MTEICLFVVRNPEGKRTFRKLMRNLEDNSKVSLTLQEILWLRTKVGVQVRGYQLLGAQTNTHKYKQAHTLTHV